MRERKIRRRRKKKLTEEEISRESEMEREN